MRKLLALGLWAILCLPAYAADNAVTLTTGSGVTMRTIDIGAGVQSSVVILGSSAGAAIYGTAGTANANVLTVQGIASGTALIVGGNIASGVADSGNPVKVGGKYNSSPITLTDGNRGDIQLDVNGYLKVNVAAATGVPQGSTTSGQTGSLIMGAVTTAAPAYTTAQTSPLSLTTTGSLRTTLLAEAAVGAAVPANLIYPGVNVAGNLVGTIGDPCQTVAKTYTPISITTATTTRIVAPAASKKTYVCYMLLTSAAADNVGIVEGTGGTCGSGTAGVIGGTTAANGPNFAANGGVSFGNGGFAVAATAGTNVDLCLITSAGTPLAGHIAWVQQ